MRNQFHFSFNSYKSVANANSKQPLQLDWDNSMDCDRGNSENKFYDNIGDLSVRSFWYHSNDTKRNPRVMLRSHFPINDSSGYLHTTVYLAVMLQASWHTAEGNKVKKFIEFCRVKRIIDQIMMDWKNVPTSNLLDIGLKSSQRRSRVAEIFPLPIKYFEQRILRYHWPREFSAMTKKNKL